jgi:glutaredoxin 3
MLIQPTSALRAFRQALALRKETRKGKVYMKHKIEIFSAGCKACNDTIEAVRKLAGSAHEVVIRDMHQHEIATHAAQHGIRSVPAVVIDGKLAGCCAGRGVDESALREALQ